MTIRIPKFVVVALAAVVLLAGAGSAGYLLGRSSRADAARDASALRKQAVVLNEDLRRFGARSGAMLRRLCEQAVSLPNRTAPRYPFTSGSECRTPTREPKGGYTLQNIDNRVTLWVSNLCEMVQTSLAVLVTEQDNCVSGLPELVANEELFRDLDILIGP